MTFDPEAILRTLSERGVVYVLVGGFAAAAHGSPMQTVDIDICYDRAPENLERLASVLQELNAKLRGVEDVPFLIDPQTLLGGDHFTFATDLGDLDLLGTPAGTQGHSDLASRAVPIDLDGRTVLVASLDDLIRMKETAGRGKDIEGVRILRALRDELDRASKKE